MFTFPPSGSAIPRRSFAAPISPPNNEVIPERTPDVIAGCLNANQGLICALATSASPSWLFTFNVSEILFFAVISILAAVTDFSISTRAAPSSTMIPMAVDIFASSVGCGAADEVAVTSRLILFFRFAVAENAPPLSIRFTFSMPEFSTRWIRTAARLSPYKKPKPTNLSGTS